MTTSSTRVLIAGASGYVGGRLLAALERRALPLRVMARRPGVFAGRVGSATEVVRGDCLDPASLEGALEGIETAYYLVHSLGAGPHFEAIDRRAARAFAAAARRQGVRRIIYLGGLGRHEQALSPHLKSRQETGALLRESGASVIELRASIVIGSGSLSFDMVRALAERLPVMVCPKWLHVECQPIAIEDVVAYLVESLSLPIDVSATFEIGGRDRVAYLDVLKEYVAQRGLRRYFISVPVLTPRLSSLWLGLVTPLYARVGRHLVESLEHATVVTDDAARRTFTIEPRGLAEAITRAMTLEDAEVASTRWSDALSASALRSGAPAAVRAGARIVDSRSRIVNAPPSAVFAPIRRIGGTSGWYYATFLWKLRGAVDLLAGGVGMRRGRRDAEHLRPGDTLDWWRVEAVEPNRLLRLSAEMRVPGRAWLQFEVTPLDDGRSELRQTAIFDPSGVWGRAYWYALLPLHVAIFDGMLAAIAERAERHAPNSRMPASENVAM